VDNVFYHISYDANLRELQEAIQEDVIMILTDPSPIVKKAMLREISRLCVFFGRQMTNDVLLSHMITYLNDNDWSLRSEFCKAMGKVFLTYFLVGVGIHGS
jgi:phosphoinositide-3-kinase regulatory subunit 4